MTCCLQELRRGADPARIFSIAFSRGDPPDFLAVSSDKGTVHVFNLDSKRIAAIPSTDATSDQPDGSSPRNPVSNFKFMSVRSLQDFFACVWLCVLPVCMLCQLYHVFRFSNKGALQCILTLRMLHQLPQGSLVFSRLVCMNSWPCRQLHDSARWLHCIAASSRTLSCITWVAAFLGLFWIKCRLHGFPSSSSSFCGQVKFVVT